MSEKNDGGPAFPTIVFQGDDHNNPEYAIGPTVRDWFAGQALIAVANRPAYKNAAEVVRDAYRLADLMLDERTQH